MPDAGLADGSVLTSANYDSYLREQVIATGLSGARPTGKEGRVIASTDTDRLECYDGTNWIRVGNWSASGRSGVQLSRFAVQSIPTGTGTFTPITWDVETTDTDAYITVPSSDILIPTGLGGLYAISCGVTWVSSPGTNSSIEVFNSTTTAIWRHPIGAATQLTSCSMSVVIPVAAAQTVQIRLSHGAAGAINISANLEMWRLQA